MQIAQPLPTFCARWNSYNSDLQTLEPTYCQKIYQVLWDALSIILFPLWIARAIGWGVKFIAKKIVLPSAWFYPKQILQRAKRVFQLSCQQLSPYFSIEKHKVLTPDGVKLNLLHFRHKQTDAETPTLIFYQSNASISYLGIYLWLIEEAVRRGSICNFVVFDYRGVGSSEGDANSSKDLLIDGDTALQFVKDYLHVPPEKINFYTWSLGGAIGSTTKARYPELTGDLVHERSFDSLKSVSQNKIPSFLKPLFFWLPWAVEKEGWNLEASLNKLRGRTLVVYHKNDPTIPYPASGHQYALKTKACVQGMELIQTPEQREEARGRWVDHHFEELFRYSVADGRKADQAIAEFILPPGRSAENSRDCARAAVHP